MEESTSSPPTPAARSIRIGGGAERIRIATHIFTQPIELNTFFDAVDAGLRCGRLAYRCGIMLGQP